MLISVECNILLYAEDSLQLTSYNGPRIVSDALYKELKRCHDWLIDNRLAPLRKDCAWWYKAENEDRKLWSII